MNLDAYSLPIEHISGDEICQDVITANHSTGASNEQLELTISCVAPHYVQELTAKAIANTRKLSRSTHPFPSA